MSYSDDVPSSPPGPGASADASMRYYKAQYEMLEKELHEFQTSSKELEAELERDIEASEKRERHLQDKASKLQYEVDEWKAKYKQAKTEAGSAQNALQKEITDLREANRKLQLRLRDIEVANDDFERQQRNTESSLEDMESKYNQAIERGVMLDEEMRSGEQEREALRIEAQRLRDEFSDLKIEADITKEKLAKVENELAGRGSRLTLRPVMMSASPRSDLSPTTTRNSTPSFDTPPAKTASSSALSDTPTPPSPPVSDKFSMESSKPVSTPRLPKTRMSVNLNTITPRPSIISARTKSHARAPSTVNGRTAPPSSFRQSMSQASGVFPKPAGLPQSSSIMHLRNLRGKMQQLEERVQTARSKLPAPANTPPKASPRSGSALGSHVPSSVTVRNRKRTGGSAISGPDSLPDAGESTPSKPKIRTSRLSLSQHNPLPSPTRGDMAAPPMRPASRSSMASRASMSSQVPDHSRPGSRASISVRPPWGGGLAPKHTPNASTDRVRPKSALSNQGYDGTMDEGKENGGSILEEGREFATLNARRTTFVKRTSDVGTALPSPSKRTSLSGVSRTPGRGKRQSMGLGELRTPSRQALNKVKEIYDMNETF